MPTVSGLGADRAGARIGLAAYNAANNILFITPVVNPFVLDPQRE